MTYREFEDLYREPLWCYPVALIIFPMLFLLGCCL